MLTPAISVVSAVQGIQFQSGISNGAVVGITCAILVALFCIQRFGTARVSAIFAPVVLVWLCCNLGIGAYNVAQRPSGARTPPATPVWGRARTHPRPSAAAVFKALSPTYMYYFWAGDAHGAWQKLGAVMLAITGSEALFADLGHFNAASIRMGWGGGARTCARGEPAAPPAPSNPHARVQLYHPGVPLPGHHVLGAMRRGARPP